MDWTEKLLDSWTFCSPPSIVGVAGQQQPRPGPASEEAPPSRKRKWGSGSRKRESAVGSESLGAVAKRRVEPAMAEKFDHLEEHLEKFVENIRQLGIIVSDFQPSSQAGLSQKLNFIVTGLQDIDKCRQQLHDITVPLEVFEYIDQGRNPQLYTKECLERALAKNEQVKGKIDTMKKFKSLLIQELSKVFPEDMAKYRSIRGEDHPPS
ncbi:mediator of RNA polymerase II transcription subunit 10 [Mastomys coucha]|nr:mediator of RNA polymerase II transcription subunit 10 [Mastomys coucha]